VHSQSKVSVPVLLQIACTSQGSSRQLSFLKQYVPFPENLPRARHQKFQEKPFCAIRLL
jgi:hypothetical protein